MNPSSQADKLINILQLVKSIIDAGVQSNNNEIFFLFEEYGLQERVSELQHHPNFSVY